MALNNTTTNILAFLDSLSQLPGSILYRNALGWQALAPGSIGATLSLDADLLPFWGNVAGYNPALITFPLSTDRFSSTQDWGTNQIKFYCRFKCSPRAGAGIRYIVLLHNGTANSRRLVVGIPDTSHSLAGRLQVFGKQSSGANLYNVSPTVRVDDDEYHTLYFSVDTINQLGTIAVDGSTTAFSVTSGTLNGGSMLFQVGNNTLFGGNHFDGSVSMLGYDAVYSDQYDLLPTDPETMFYIDTDSWDQWESKPMVWNPYADCSNNLGYRSNFSKVGSPLFVPE